MSLSQIKNKCKIFSGNFGTCTPYIVVVVIVTALGVVVVVAVVFVGDCVSLD